MRLVFYSGGDGKVNRELDLEVLRLTGKKNPTMTYVPSCSWGGHKYFERLEKGYRRIGIRVSHVFAVDVPFDPRNIREALSSDIVYLAGGNTFYFLKHLKRVGMLPHLRRYSKKGVLVGLSAGAIIMTPQIRIAGLQLPSQAPDPNEVGLRDFRSLNLVPFEFSPHFGHSRGDCRAVGRYAKQSGHTVLACDDGAGIVVEGKRISTVGRIWSFSPTEGALLTR